MKNIAFIINPVSGTQNKRRIPKLIEQSLDKSQWLPNIIYTKYAGQATELSQQYARMGFDAVVAVGGDGTVNEVARGLCGTDTALGIIPIGSGNGFARHLHIPLYANRAIEMLNNSEMIRVDYGMAEEHPFFCTCGSGFDAVVAEKFAQAGNRGLMTYVQTILKEFLTYSPQPYHLSGEGIDIETEALLLTVANANQWGNAAYIAPRASIQDGLLDVAIVSKFPLTAVPDLTARLFQKTLDETTYMTTLHVSDVTIHRAEEGPFHIDGDPIHMPKDIHIHIVRDGLHVLVEKRF